MTDQSKSSNPETLTGSRNVISSPGSESGPTLSDSPDGPTTDLFGQEVVPASRSLQRAKKRASPTPATFGPAGFGSPASIALSQSLANRLNERFEAIGSTLYQQTWKRKVTPSGRPYSAHIASARHTSASASISSETETLAGYPTPIDNDAQGSTHCYGTKPTDGSDRARFLKLPGAAQLAGYPTPADDANFGHDVFGISRYIDRDTGQLTDHFLPRFSRPKKKARGRTSRADARVQKFVEETNVKKMGDMMIDAVFGR